MGKSCLILSALLMVWLCGAVDSVLCNIKSNLKPMAFTQYYLQPDTARELRFTAPENFTNDSYECIVLNFAGKEIGKNVLRKEGNLYSVNFTLPQGFYTVLIPEGPARFGLSVLPDAVKPDPFFCMETLLRAERKTTTERFTAKEMSEILSVLKNAGITNIREFPGLSTIRSVDAAYNPEWDQIYRTVADMKMSAICAFNNIPSLYGTNWNAASADFQPYPDHVKEFAEAVLDDATRRSPGLETFQILNEVDMRPAPPDRVGATLAAVAYTFDKEKLPIKVCGPGLASFSRNESLVRIFLDNGMSEYADALAVHSYGDPSDISRDIREFRKILKNYPNGNMPVWYTECGMPWSRGFMPDKTNKHVLGKSHPILAEELKSAAWTTMKAVEAKVCGISRYYPFVMKFYPENDKNFGMTDQQWAPLLPLNAYFECIREIGNMDYAGNPAKMPGKVQRARIFAGAERAVMVVFDPAAKYELDLEGVSFTAVRSIDGSPVEVKDGKAEIIGHMAYVELDPEKYADIVNGKTAEMALYKAAKSYKPHQRKSVPVIFYTEPTQFKVKNSSGYNLAENYFQIVAENISDADCEIEPELKLPEYIKAKSASPKKRITLKPGEKAVLRWELEKSSGKANFNFIVSDCLGNANTISVPLFESSGLVADKMQFNNIRRWRMNSCGKGKIEWDAEENALKVTVDFGDLAANRWCYPRFRVRPKEDLRKAVGIRYETKLSSESTAFPGSHLVMIKTKGEDTRYLRTTYTPFGWEWQKSMVLFNMNEVEMANVEFLKIGMHSGGPKLVFWIRNIELLFNK